MRNIVVLTVFLLMLVGCQPSPESVGEEVKTLLQAKLDSDPDFKAYHLTVSRVDVIREEGNKYHGLATVSMDGEDHTVSLKVLADGKKVMYETEPLAFAFVAQRVLKETLSSLSNAQSPSAATQSGLKEGWTSPQLSSFVQGCVQGVVTPTRRDYELAAARAGNSATDFPEQELSASVEQMCSCLSMRIAKSWGFSEFMLNQQAYFQPLVEEAMSGGQCKPSGLLAEILNHARNS